LTYSYGYFYVVIKNTEFKNFSIEFKEQTTRLRYGFIKAKNHYTDNDSLTYESYSILHEFKDEYSNEIWNNLRDV